MMNDKDLIAKLRAEKFDLAISEPFMICGFGRNILKIDIMFFFILVLFDELNIPSTIAAQSTAPMSPVSKAIGEPQLISHVPSNYYY